MATRARTCKAPCTRSFALNYVKRRRAEIANAQVAHETRIEAKANGARASRGGDGNDFHGDELGDVAL
jgi:hypothetical protein